jgi:hypothetical protein
MSFTGISEQNSSLTERDLALQLFTNRHGFTKRFAEYLNDEPSPNKILFFHGDGGNGKSLLMTFLREKCCKRFVSSDWQSFKAKPNDELAADIENAQVYTPIPAAWLDFGQAPRGNEQPQDLFCGLLMLRYRLEKAASELKFPHYDYACERYLQKKGMSSKDVKKLFMSEKWASIGEIAEAFAESPWFVLLKKLPDVMSGFIKPRILDNVQKKVDDAIPDFIKEPLERELDKSWIKNVKAMDPDTDLIDNLPHWFAQDLNVAMTGDKAPPRLVLFFDSHEAFWGERRDLSEYRFFYKDEWLRRLLNSLELSKGIVVVVAGREKPRWAESPKLPIPQTALEVKAVGHLSEADALSYLQKADILEAELQNALITYASVKPKQVHPFLLGLCADVVLAAERRHTPLNMKDFDNVPEIVTRTKEVISRLLQYVEKEVEYAIYALSACRRFNRELYFKLGDALHFNPTGASFEIITQFSFVWRHKYGSRRIHDLLRRFYHRYGNDSTRDAHVFLEKYYRDHGNLPETIYHAICHDWLRGVKELLKVFKSAKQQGDFELCRTLLEIRTETSLYLEKSHKP